MTRSTVRPADVERLAHHLLEGVDDVRIGDEVGVWLAESRRFRDFADVHRDKIRKKLRTAGDEAARADVRAELRSLGRCSTTDGSTSPSSPAARPAADRTSP